MNLTQRQVELNRVLGGDAQHIMLYGGSRSGKTFLIVRAIVIRALKSAGSRHAILRFRFNAVRASVALDTFPKVMSMCFPAVKYRVDRSTWYAEFQNGSQIWFGGLDDKDRTEKILGQEFCVDPDSKVLMADLTWTPAINVRKGDKIIAFPEDLEGHQKLVGATVVYNDPLIKRRYRVSTNKGEIIVSEGHKFVAYYDDRRVRNFRPLSWKKVEELSPGDKLRFATEPWVTDRSYDGGWLSGMFDGEGWASERGQVGVAQNSGLVLDRIREVMDARGFKYREHCSNGQCVQLILTNLWQGLRAIGSLRPVRLLANSSILWENRRGFNGHGDSVESMSRHSIRVDARHVAEILNIEQLDDGPVRAIQTTSKTLITDGFLSHNCSIFLNECSQIPYSSRNIALTRLAQNCEQCLTIDGHQSVSGLPLRMYYDQNPPSRAHWTYSLFELGTDPETKNALANRGDYVSAQMNPKDNEENLPDGYLDSLRTMSSRFRTRFLEGEYRDATPGQLFVDSDIDKWRVVEDKLPDFQRIVIAVDPSGSGDTENAQNDAIGICVMALGVDGVGYLLEDLTLKAGPATWGRVVATAFDRHGADLVVGEQNYGGEMVRYTVLVARPGTPYRPVDATRGKVVRAEPIGALVETGKVRMVGNFRELEEELAGFTTSGYVGERSPNRADAFVWAATALFQGMVRGRKEKPVPAKQPQLYPQMGGWMGA